MAVRARQRRTPSTILAATPNRGPPPSLLQRMARGVVPQRSTRATKAAGTGTGYLAIPVSSEWRVASSEEYAL
jgi:hypothetical protein